MSDEQVDDRETPGGGGTASGATPADGGESTGDLAGGWTRPDTPLPGPPPAWGAPPPAWGGPVPAAQPEGGATQRPQVPVQPEGGAAQLPQTPVQPRRPGPAGGAGAPGGPGVQPPPYRAVPPPYQPYGRPQPGYLPAAGPALQWVSRPGMPAQGPARRFTLPVLVVVGLVTALLGCMCGGTIMAVALGDESGQPVAVDERETDAVAPTVSEQLLDIKLGAGADLLARALPLPAGATELTVPGSDAGIYSPEQYSAKRYPHDDAALKRLRQWDLAVAAERGWTAVDGSEVHIQLLQFRSTWGATRYYEADSAAESSQSSTDPFAIPVSGGRGSGVVRGSPDEHNRRVAVGTVPYWNVVVKISTATPAQPTRESMIRLCDDQVGRLRS